MVNVVAPPLRERKGDITIWLTISAAECGDQWQKGSGSAQKPCGDARHSWPGNVRELENRVKRAVIMSEKKQLSPADLDIAPAAQEEGTDSLKDVRSAAEREHVVKVLGKCGWNISKAAHELGISRPTLHDFIKKHDISKR